jgi:hypothetical protein
VFTKPYFVTQLANEDSATAAQNIVQDVESYCLDLKGDEEILVNFASSHLKLAVVSFVYVPERLLIFEGKF